MTTKIRTVTLETPHRADAHLALRAACAPFGSLDPVIVDLAFAYLDGGSTVDDGIALLRATRALAPPQLVTALTAYGEWSELLLGGSRVQLITPTSGTVITMRRHGAWSLKVDFGDH